MSNPSNPKTIIAETTCGHTPACALHNAIADETLVVLDDRGYDIVNRNTAGPPSAWQPAGPPPDPKAAQKSADRSAVASALDEPPRVDSTAVLYDDLAPGKIEQPPAGDRQDTAPITKT